MHLTRAARGGPEPARRAQGYSFGAEVPSFELDAVSAGAGDIWSTAADMARWDSGLVDGRLLSADGLAQMFTPHVDGDRKWLNDLGLGRHEPQGVDYSYGYGWLIAKWGQHRVVIHTGDNAGFVAFNGCVLGEDIILVLLANDDGLDVTAAGVRILRAILAHNGGR